MTRLRHPDDSEVHFSETTKAFRCTSILSNYCLLSVLPIVLKIHKVIDCLCLVRHGNLAAMEGPGPNVKCVHILSLADQQGTQVTSAHLTLSFKNRICNPQWLQNKVSRFPIKL